MATYLRKIPLLGRLFKEKEVEGKEKKEKRVERTCNCEICRFSDEIDSKIPDEYTRNLVSSFVVRSSDIKSINPNEKLEEAEKLRKEGKFSQAAQSYRNAALASFYQKSDDTQKYWEAYESFVGKHNLSSDWYSESIKAYNELRKKEDIIKILTDTYENSIRVSAEAEKKKKS